MLCDYDHMITMATNSAAETDALWNTTQTVTPKGKQTEASVQMSYSKLCMQRCARSDSAWGPYLCGSVTTTTSSTLFGIFPICVVFRCPAQSLVHRREEKKKSKSVVFWWKLVLWRCPRNRHSSDMSNISTKSVCCHFGYSIKSKVNTAVNEDSNTIS